MARRLKIEELETVAEEALRDCLAEVPFVVLSDVRRPDSGGPDLLARVRLPDGDQALVVETNEGIARTAIVRAPKPRPTEKDLLRSSV